MCLRTSRSDMYTVSPRCNGTNAGRERNTGRDRYNVLTLVYEYTDWLPRNADCW